MQKILLVIVLSFSTFLTSYADEGMFLLNLIGKNYDQMKAQGFRLKPEDIYSVEHSSIKDATAIFGGYCTCEIVSDQGLIFTNYHCGEQSIHQLSSIKENFIENGFAAKKMKDELPVEGLYIKFLVTIEDVTDDLLAGVKDSDSYEDRMKTINKNTILKKSELERKYAGEKYQIKIDDFFNGNAYYAQVYKTYNDIRLVCAPPASMGKFGGDTDNWMWPRHTCDFSVFRVYADANGNPASYSEKNIPLKPKKFYNISLKEKESGDFAAVIGFPGSTSRYVTSYELENIINIENQARIDARTIILDIIKSRMRASDTIMLKYTSRSHILSNYWKNAIEANKSMRKLSTVKEKEDFQQSIIKLNSEAAGVLEIIKNSCVQSTEYLIASNYYEECLLSGCEFANFAFKMNNLLQDDKKDAMKEESIKFFKNYDHETDKEVSAAMVKLFLSKVNKQYWPESFKAITDVDQYINDIFSKSIFVSEEKFNNWLKKSDPKALESDPGYIYMATVITKYRELYTVNRSNEQKLDEGKQKWMKILQTVSPQTTTYPDANFSMRMTYGTVKNYIPRDGVIYKHYTTLEGVMEKEIHGDVDFDVPAKLKELYAKKNYGNYADRNGQLRTCFTTDNDITGGNSGSPVFNGDGDLIGLAFDGNSEAMCGDYLFNKELQRCICVDINYVLFVIDKYFNCQNLIGELVIKK